MSDRKDGSAKFTYQHEEADADFNKLMGVEKLEDLAKQDLGSIALGTGFVQQVVRIEAPLATESATPVQLDQQLSSAS